MALEIESKYDIKLNYLVGTMIELPRACLTADEIAEHAEFFSFGTNDLTQTTYGFSRDDIGSFLPEYLDRNILPGDPFQSLDVKGVGKLVSMAVKYGRDINPSIKIGICGEHGGDPNSIHFCKENYYLELYFFLFLLLFFLMTQNHYPLYVEVQYFLHQKHLS